MTDLVDDPVPLLMEQVPGLSEEDARSAARGCVGQIVLEERAGMALTEVTFPLPDGGECTLWSVAWFVVGEDADVARDDLYADQAEAEAAWGREELR